MESIEGSERVDQRLLAVPKPCNTAVQSEACTIEFHTYLRGFTDPLGIEQRIIPG